MNKPPAFQFYARDWLVGTDHLTLEQQGAYVHLLCREWEYGGPLPFNEKAMARWLRVRLSTFRRIWLALAPHFRRIGHAYVANPRLEKIRRERIAYHQSQSRVGKIGAAKRWHSDPNGDGIATPMAKNGSASASASASALTTTTEASRVPRATWVVQCGNAWQARYGGTPPYGKIGKHVKPFAARADLQERWVRYLGQTEAAYASPARFAETYGAWGVQSLSVTTPVASRPVYKTADELDRIAGIPLASDRRSNGMSSLGDGL